MAFIEAVNSKSNVKQFTNNDLPFANGQPVINSYYATSTAGQTVINLPNFSINTTSSGYTDNFWLFVDGKKLDLGSSNDFTFTSVNSDGTSSQVTLTQSLVAGLNIQAFKLGLKPEIQFGMDNRFVQLYEYLGDNFQGCINPSEFTLTATSSVGTPPAGQFYSSINGRASLIDLSQDLKPRFGIERIMTETVMQVQNEFGPSNQQVWASPNDLFGQIRFVGGWTPSQDSSGERISAGTTSDFVEITFYGTGLNVLVGAGNTALQMSYQVDGGSATTFFNQTSSAVLSARNYGTNQSVPVVSGLALGTHTVTINAVSGSNVGIYGFEPIVKNTTSTNICVNPGVGYNQGQKYITAAQQLFAYNSAVTGTTGGRIVIYQASSGSIGAAFTAIGSSPTFLTSATHTGEEVSRTYHWREFGSGRSDDFSRLSTAGITSAAFTLDDGTTTLTASNVEAFNGSNNIGNDLRINNTGGSTYFITFTFVGTGLDIIAYGDNTGTTTNYSLIVDNVNEGSIAPNFTSSGVAGMKRIPLCSGLPYGTHVVQILQTAASANPLNIRQFVTYQPKTPSIPAGSIQIGSYNVMANYIPNTVQGTYTIAQGVLRKMGTREMVYVGSDFTIPAINTSFLSGMAANGTNTGDSIQYTFFGTGFEIRPETNGGAYNIQINVDGSTNLSGYTTAFYGSLTSFTAATGTVVVPSNAGFYGNGVVVYNMPLGIHTVTVTKTSGAGGNYWVDCFDVVTPIHSPKSNLYVDLQNTLPIGSQAISDDRQITPIKQALPQSKAWAQATGISSSPSSTSTDWVPVPDMSVTIKTNGGAIQIFWGMNFNNSSSSGANRFQLYVDGVVVPNSERDWEQMQSAGYNEFGSDMWIIPVSAGVHKVDLFWQTGAGNTINCDGTQRVLSVREL